MATKKYINERMKHAWTQLSSKREVLYIAHSLNEIHELE